MSFPDPQKNEEELTARVFALEEQVTILKAERDDANHVLSEVQGMLRGLLSVVHRDGGQYVDEHGFETASADAHVVVVKLLSDSGNLDRLAKAFENAMELVRDKLKLWYVSGWTAGRVEDERVTLGASREYDTEIFMKAIASYNRFLERTHQQLSEALKEPSKS